MLYPLNQNPEFCYNSKHKKGKNQIQSLDEFLLDGFDVLDEVKHRNSKKHYTIERIEDNSIFFLL